MEYRALGRTGVQVSPLCLGCMMFGGKTNEVDSIAMIDHAVEQGINFIDTANSYSRGESEKVVGNALSRDGKRDRIVLATKVFGKMGDDPNMFGNHRRNIIEGCEASLRRLRTDWIDLYQIHRPMPRIPIDETLRALDDLVRSGKVRYLGTSTFAAWQVMESLWVAKELGLNRFVCEQPPYNLLDRRIERELVPMCLTYGLAIIPWSPIAQGMLTDKYTRGEPAPSGARLQPDYLRGDMVRNEAAFDIRDRVAAIAKEKGCATSQLAVAWTMHQPGITSPIIGPRTMEQLVDNLGALDVEVTDGDRERLDEVAKPGEAVSSFYKADWGRALHRW